MSISFLKGSRTKYRILLEKELEKGRILIQEDTKEQYAIHFFSKRLSNCISRLNDIIEKLEQTDERLSVVVEGHDEAQEVEQLITEDWSYIAEVLDSRYELEDIQQSLQVQRSSQENVSSRTVTENKFNQILHLTSQMQHILVDQQQLQQQQLKSVQPSSVFDEGCYIPQDSLGAEDCDNFKGSTGGRDCYMPQDSVGAEDCENFEEITGGRDCYMPQDSIGAEDCENFEGSTGGRDCYMPQDSVGAEDCENFEGSTGGRDCCMPQDSVGAEDCENFEGSTGGRDCYMPQDSVGAEDYDGFEKRTGCRECYMPKDSIGGDYFNSCGDSTGRTDCENKKGFMDCHSFKISIGNEESFSCKNNDTDSKHCKDGKKGGYFNTKEGYKSREDYSGFEDCDRGKILRKDNDTEICANHYTK